MIHFFARVIHPCIFFISSLQQKTQGKKDMEKRQNYLPPVADVVELTAAGALLQGSPTGGYLEDYGNEITTEWL